MKKRNLYFFLTVGILIILFLISDFLMHQFSLNIQHKEKIDEKEHFISIILLKNFNELKNAVYDYSYWDDLVNYIKKPDKKWANENLESAFISFDFDYIWVYNEKKKLVSFLKNSSVISVKDIIPKNAILHNFDTSENSIKRNTHFFIKSSLGYIEIFGETIHPSSDNQKQFKPKGYLFFGKLWHIEKTAFLGNLTNSNVLFTSDKVLTEYNKKTNKIIISKEFYDWKNDFLGSMVFSTTDEFYIKSRYYSALIHIFEIIGFIIIISFIFYFSFNNFFKPIKELFDSILSKNLKQLNKISLSSNELGEIATTFLNTINSHKNKEEFERIKEELTLSKEKAIESDKLKSAFLANMSHEIRSPLNTIIGFSEVMERGQLTDEKRKQFTSLIHNSSKQLLLLINDIIDISRIEAGQLKIVEKTVILNALCNDQLKMAYQLKEKANKNNVTIIFNQQDNNNEKTLILDPLRLQQILTNLLSNAIKFTNFGIIEFGYHFKENSMIEFYVKDSGIGISLENQKKLFQRFSQVNQDDENYTIGSGLGLIISKGLVELMGGTIWLKSNPSEGSTFYFTIRYKNLTITTNNKSITDDPRENIPNLKGKTILIVEDELNNYIFLEELLLNTNATLIHCESGEDAIKIAKENYLDLILMDIKIKGLNGYETTYLIKQLKKEIPIIIQSAFVMEDQKEKAYKSGCNDFISKPIDTNLFFNLLKKYLL